MLNKKTIKDIDVKGKRVLLRCDFNVPTKNFVVSNDIRIKNTLQTINYLKDCGAKIIICTHLGRPKNGYDEKYSLKPVYDLLVRLIGPIHFCPPTVGKEAQNLSNFLNNGDVMFLENLRFFEGETKNCPIFAKELANLCDIYINDAFGVSHRNHASVCAITRFVPICGAGFLLQKEIDILGKKLSKEVTRPYVAIVGGSKVSDKIAVVQTLLKRANSVIIGGGMAFTFLAAQGYSVGKSLIEEDKIEIARATIDEANERGVNLLLPVDVRVTKEFPQPIDEIVDYKNVYIQNIKKDMMGLDIGEESERIFADEVLGAKTVLWNGPMGVFENPIFAQGTMAVAKAVARATDRGALSVVGGGDSAAAAVQCLVADKITHISTGGGASLAFIEGKELPGIAGLSDK